MLLGTLFLVLTVAYAVIPPNELAELTCGYNYTLFDDWCYRLYSYPLSNYDEARSICQSDNADLVSIHDAFASIYVGNKDKEGVLIGLKYYEEDSTYNWSDGTQLDYTNYADGFVEYRDFLGYCAKNVLGKWTNAQCKDDRMKFVCRKKSNNVVVTLSGVCPNATTIYFPSGLLLSPGYPDQFSLDQAAQDTGCYYQLAGKNEYYTRIKFEEMFLQEKSGNIEVYRGWDEKDSNEVTRVDNDFEGSELTVKYNRVLLHLNGVVHGKWKISWETFKAPAEEMETPADKCPEENIVYTEPNTISSPGYPSVFHLAEDAFLVGCSYRLIARGGYYIRLWAEEIRLEESVGRIDVFEGWTISQQSRVNSFKNVDEGKELLVAADKVIIRFANASRGTYRIKWSAQACKDDWQYFDGACYFYKGSLESPPLTRSFCAAVDSNLTSIASQAENDFVHSMMKAWSIWLGLIKTDMWQWIDGTPYTSYTYKNWAPGQPTGSCNEGYMKSNGIWYCSVDSDVSFGVCKQRIDARKRK